MNFFDLIAFLKKEPKPDQVARGMNFFAVGCAFAGIWNFSLSTFDERFRQPPFNLPDYYPQLSLGFFLTMALLFFLSGRGISRLAHWGKRLAQFNLVALLFSFGGFFLLVMKNFPSNLPFTMIFMVFYGIPTYFGVRYLGRLPVRTESFLAEPPEMIVPAPAPAADVSTPQKYHKDLLLFGPIGAMAIIIGAIMLAFQLTEKYFPDYPELIMATFFLAFFCMIAANYLPSPFQKSRQAIASFTGGGGTWWFHGSYPFVRLLVYVDGVELRIVMQRYFIPYKKMSPPAKKVSFFTSGLLFESDLPGVPSRFRFGAWGMEKIAKLVRENYDRA